MEGIQEADGDALPDATFETARESRGGGGGDDGDDDPQEQASLGDFG